MAAQKTRRSRVSIVTKQRAREAFADIFRGRRDLTMGRIVEKLAEAMSDTESQANIIDRVIWSAFDTATGLEGLVQPDIVAQIRERHSNNALATEAAQVAEILDYIRENIDFREFKSAKVGTREVNSAEAIKGMEIGRIFAPLSRAWKIKDEGRYWISMEGLSAFLEPGHPYYLNNMNGTFSKCSKEEWDEANWSERVLITSDALKKIAEGGKGLLVLKIGDAETGRLTIESGDLKEAIPTSVPKIKSNNATAKAPEVSFPAWRVQAAKAELGELGVDLSRAPALREMFRDV